MVLEKIGFEKYNHNLWVLRNTNGDIKYFATISGDKLSSRYSVNLNKIPLKYHIRDIYMTDIISTSDEQELRSFIKNFKRDDIIDSLI